MDIGMIAITFTIVTLVLLAGWAHYQWYLWRRLALRQAAFINDPNVKARDKEQEYKDSYEARINALEDERREQHEAMLEVFDFLNDNAPFGSHQEGLTQCRNKLMITIQNSTYGRE